MEVYRWAMSYFWHEPYWLPRNVTWPEVPAKFVDLLVPIYLAIPLVIIRILWESTIGVTYLYFRTNAYASRKNITLLGCMWEHMTGGFASVSRAKKILECFWRFSYYTFAFLYGLYVMKNSSWLYDVKQCWIGYPFHPVPDTIWWYYMIETGFYYSLLIGSTFDVRRSDFWQLMVHHVITIFLLSSSWTINFVRVGTLILLSHDVSDVFLEGGKLVRYDAHNKNMTNFMFVLFFSSWVATRLIYYPFIVIRSAVTEAAALIQPDYILWDYQLSPPYAPRLIVFALILLFFLHIFWTFIILRIAYRTSTGGQAKDVRSDSDSDYDEEEMARRERTRLLKKKKNKVSPSTDDDDDEGEEEKNDRKARHRRAPRKE
ncbi:TLC domain-containing protein [Caenorhabditis elegans]|uniref:TLC domain-containing protein n=2 Tax=Caenorhabditis elegans TaxID=6239 RepID=X5LPS5_CAEEL|nr:TLC domain-containing protein [Caenorhabditis elegans]CDO41071.1 TLC domain-containing protein [Caenorhabditis elegans]|eukprot:NP_001294030.1 Ceramide synthase hyl-1 [Caenorhabditis elegans]